uniref:Uncharacterized protein n=1 Tax=Arundo donax TaxID=35708 RepID=A0A0A9FRH7_ARUDO
MPSNECLCIFFYFKSLEPPVLFLDIIMKVWGDVVDYSDVWVY